MGLSEIDAELRCFRRLIAKPSTLRNDHAPEVTSTKFRTENRLLARYLSRRLRIGQSGLSVRCDGSELFDR
jgi:hypothetical protein